MPVFRSLSVSSLSARNPPPPLRRTYSIQNLGDVGGNPSYPYLYYYPYFRSFYPHYQYKRFLTYTDLYSRHYSNWPEHHFSNPYKHYKPLSFYGSYTYSPYQSYKSPSGYYYGWYNGLFQS